MADLTSMLQAAAGQAGEATDPFFNQTTLLLHGDGTNGAQNNTFLDSSTNNFTITRNGNTTQGTFSPFSLPNGEWSNFFAPADFISTPNNAAIQLGSSDFTIEAWIYVTEHGSLLTGISNNYASTGDQRGWMFNVTASAIEVRLTSAGTSASIVILSHSATINLNTWYWVAVTRSGTTFSFYVDGTRVGTSTDSTTIFASSAAHQIGNGNASATDARFGGYISNYRLIKGTALYTAATVTVPTAPLTAVANTSVLACQSNRFVDNSSNAFAVTISGTPSVQPFSPFLPSAAYDPSVNGGSGYFDGSGDNLSVADNAVLDLGGNNFTIEGWFNFSASVSGTGYTLVAKAPSAFNTQASFAFWRNTSNVLRFIFSTDGGSTNIATIDTTNAFTPAVGEWYHLAVARSGTTFYIFINGVSQSLTTSFLGTATSSSSIFDSTTALTIGSFSGNDLNFNGFASNVRLTNGSALYTAAFTPSTSPFTTTSQGASSSQVELLCNFTNAGIFDNTGKNNLETVGDAQIDTSVKKYGTGSMEFDGTGDYLVTAGPTENFIFGTGDFTIEFWVYTNSSGTYTLYDQRPLGANNLSPTLYLDSNNIRFFTDGADKITGGSVANATWTHIALSRASGSTKLFLSGTQTGSTYSDTNNYTNSSGRPFIGGGSVVAGQNPLNGYIDDLRITKGVARYTTTFTPPTAAFPDF